MGFYEVFLIGVGLSMDAFAASICKGLNMKIMKKTQRFHYCAVFWRISGANAFCRLDFRKTVRILYHKI